jgi:hypothetical protein
MQPEHGGYSSNAATTKSPLSEYNQVCSDIIAHD